MLDLIIFGLTVLIVIRVAMVIMDYRQVKGMLKAFNFEQAKEDEDA